MSWRVRTIALVVAIALAGCGGHRKNDVPAETAGPNFANLCITRDQWPYLLQYMRKFAAIHGLEFHGGVDNYTPDHRPQINAYIAKGYSYYFGDDFDLWFVRDPFRENVVTLSGILKRKPITPEQTMLAAALLRGIAGVARLASGPSDNPSCVTPAAPGNAR